MKKFALTDAKFLITACIAKKGLFTVNKEAVPNSLRVCQSTLCELTNPKVLLLRIEKTKRIRRKKGVFNLTLQTYQLRYVGV